jgi:hypothetical protein
MKVYFISERMAIHREGKLPPAIPRGGALHRKAQQREALLRAFLTLSLLSKLKGFKTKKPWSAKWLTGLSDVARRGIEPRTS